MRPGVDLDGAGRRPSTSHPESHRPDIPLPAASALSRPPAFQKKRRRPNGVYGPPASYSLMQGGRQYGRPVDRMAGVDSARRRRPDLSTGDATDARTGREAK